MHREPSWRIPVGVLLLLTGLLAYGVMIARFIAPHIAGWSALLQLPIYAVLGVIWLLPLRRFLIWMETGRWG
jgi:hypothetical protein